MSSSVRLACESFCLPTSVRLVCREIKLHHVHKLSRLTSLWINFLPGHNNNFWSIDECRGLARSRTDLIRIMGKHCCLLGRLRCHTRAHARDKMCIRLDSFCCVIKNGNLLLVLLWQTDFHAIYDRVVCLSPLSFKAGSNFLSHAQDSKGKKVFCRILLDKFLFRE